MRERWAPLTIEVALELLSNQFQVNNDAAMLAIREHVSAYLDTLSDAVLSSFLLQLVQAMRPERIASHRPISDLLTRRARHSKLFGSKFFWYMKVEAETEDDDGAWYKSMTLEFLDGVRAADEQLYQIYRRQDVLVKTLRDLYRYISERGKNNRLEMQDLMQKEIASGKFAQLKAFEPLPFPLNPSIEV